MILSKNSQTNWKYISIVIVLALVVCGGILYYWRIVNQEFPLAEFSQVKKIEKIELPEEIINKIINETIPTEYDKSLAGYQKDDLNGDGSPEIIITAIPFERATQAYLVIVTILDNKGDYKKIADFNFYQEEYEITFGSTPGIKSSEMIKDINNDGLIEIQLGWWLGTLRPFTDDAFLVLDWSRQAINWLQLLDENNREVPAIFSTGWGGNSGGFRVGNVYTIDVNKDGKLEIVELSQESSQNIYVPDLEREIERWEAKVYEWDGSIFSYNKELSISGKAGEMPEWLKNVAPSFKEPWGDIF